MWTKSSSSAFPRHPPRSLAAMSHGILFYFTPFLSNNSLITFYIAYINSSPSHLSTHKSSLSSFSLIQGSAFDPQSSNISLCIVLSLPWLVKKRASNSSEQQLRCMTGEWLVKKNKAKKIQPLTRGQRRSYNALDARAWRPSFVTSTTTMLTSQDISVRAARDTGRQVGPYEMFLLEPAAGKLSLLARVVLVGIQRSACMMALVRYTNSSQMELFWRSGTWQQPMAVSVKFSP